MERRRFIRSVLALAALPWLPAAGSAVGCRSPSRLVRLLACPVAGFRYYRGPALISGMQSGDLVALQREPANPYDELAIALYWRNEKIGFIPRTDNPVLARMLDSDLGNLAGEIISVDTDAFPWEAVWLTVSMEVRDTG